MWYKVDFNKLTFLLLPTFLRKPKLFAYLQALVAPIISIYDIWYNWRIDNLYKIENTGQICYLRGSLNDSFDPIERRIYIDDGQTEETTYIFTDAEEQDVWLDTELEDDTLWLYTSGETDDSELDFIVYVPQSVYDTQLNELKAHVNFYRAGGKRYNIFIDE